jgi:hypothetical protein
MSTVPVILTGSCSSQGMSLHNKTRHSHGKPDVTRSGCRPIFSGRTVHVAQQSHSHNATTQKNWSMKYTAAKSYKHTNLRSCLHHKLYHFTLRVPCAMRFCDLLWCSIICNGYLCEQSMQAALSAMIPHLRTEIISKSTLLLYSCLTVLSLSRPCPLNSTDLTSCFSNHEIPLKTIKCFAILFCCQAVTDKCW